MGSPLLWGPDEREMLADLLPEVYLKRKEAEVALFQKYLALEEDAIGLELQLKSRRIRRDS